MQITEEMMRRSVAGELFGKSEPFVTGGDHEIASFYQRVFTGLASCGLHVIRETAHFGSGYASYIPIFVYPDSRARRQSGGVTQITGLLIYFSRLAALAVYGASVRSESGWEGGFSGGCIESGNLGVLPVDAGLSPAEWQSFLQKLLDCLGKLGIEVLPRAALLAAAPPGITVPSLFNPPCLVLDTLFYRCD